MNSSEFKACAVQDIELEQDSQLGDATAMAAKDALTITKAKLANLLFSDVDKDAKLSKREAQDMVEAFFEVISATLASGTSVKLSGFGSFQLRDKSSRPGFNLQTGDRILIAPRRVVTFHASQKLKQQIEVVSK